MGAKNARMRIRREPVMPNMSSPDKMTRISVMSAIMYGMRNDFRTTCASVSSKPSWIHTWGGESIPHI
jgi:hypothetical protein